MKKHYVAPYECIDVQLGVSASHLAIYSIIEHPALYKTLRENGRREVKNITWEKVGWKVRDVYNKLGVES